MKYNESLLQPPGPVISIRVSPAKRHDPWRHRLAEIDTGADISVIPDSLAADLQLKMKGPVVLYSYDKTPVERSTYLIDLQILGYTLHSIRVVAAPRDTILMGRDVLKHFIVTLDGKAQTFEMIDP